MGILPDFWIDTRPEYSMSSISESDIFQCKMCGDCCKGYGGTYVTQKDIKAISDYIKTDPKRFIAKYCSMSGKRPVLTQGQNGYCIFWDKHCTIHPVKPRMCRAWPFIEPVLIDSSNWTAMAGSCPGIRTDVPEHILKEKIKKTLSELDASYRPSHK